MRIRIVTWVVLTLAAILAVLHSAGAQSQTQRPATTASLAKNLDSPLVLAKQGSFFVNEQNIATAFPTGTGTPVPGHISAKGMYVQYQIPAARDRRAYPVVMVHGSGHTGKTYEETPDGRIGWAEYFVRRGVPVYVVDHSGRARSGFDPSPSNRAKFESNPALIPSFAEFTNENAWTTFRFDRHRLRRTRTLASRLRHRISTLRRWYRIRRPATLTAARTRLLRSPRYST